MLCGCSLSCCVCCCRVAFVELCLLFAVCGRCLPFVVGCCRLSLFLFSMDVIVECCFVFVFVDVVAC